MARILIIQRMSHHSFYEYIHKKLKYKNIVIISIRFVNIMGKLPFFRLSQLVNHWPKVTPQTPTQTMTLVSREGSPARDLMF